MIYKYSFFDDRLSCETIIPQVCYPVNILFSSKESGFFMYRNDRSPEDQNAFIKAVAKAKEKRIKELEENLSYEKDFIKSLCSYVVVQKGTNNVVCSDCCAVFAQKEIVYDAENDIERCPYCGHASVIHITPKTEFSKKTAEWYYDPDGCDWGIPAWKCSNCHTKNDNLGHSRDIDPYQFAGGKYCPCCGKKMIKTKK